MKTAFVDFGHERALLMAAGAGVAAVSREGQGLRGAYGGLGAVFITVSLSDWISRVDLPEVSSYANPITQLVTLQEITPQ